MGLNMVIKLGRRGSSLFEVVPPLSAAMLLHVV